MYDDHMLIYPHEYSVTFDPDDKMQYLELRYKMNCGYGKPMIYRPEADFLVNPTHVKHDAFGDISNESSSYFFKVRYGI